MSRPALGLGALATALGGLLFSDGARANGRYPAANALVFDSASPDRALLRTTFGLLTTVDGARSWRWVCEAALSDGALRDPAVVVGAGGRTVVAAGPGVATSTTLCQWDHPTGLSSATVVDLTADATGAHVLAALANPDGSDGVARSDDGGGTWRAGPTVSGLLAVTVDIAPSQPSRAWLSGNLGEAPVLYRSDDGAGSFREVTRDFAPGSVVYIAAVDPTDPDVLFLRATTGAAGTSLLRSDDGGAHVRELTRTASPMVGFALSDDGRTVWVAGSAPAEGLQRSVNGGAFAPVGGPHAVLCLRYHAGVLWMCADESVEGFALGRSLDGGAHFDPVLRLRDVLGPEACAADAAAALACNPLWPTQRAAFPAIDAGGPAPRSDAGAPVGADTHCNCDAVGAGASPSARLGALLVSLLGLRRLRPRAAVTGRHQGGGAGGARL